MIGNKCKGKQKAKPRMDNSETQATLDAKTQKTIKQNKQENNIKQHNNQTYEQHRTWGRTRAC